ncbi:hypothetical protein DO021_20465 [Desulfobacter hydrogenophilus]|uniref:Uncharacterized protein n=1 Tax=Desulfobacter hydrogenophilus TaxID=2291 RepID=A0A328F6L3_9BACT|nr:hypothetical protein [Desulfobacter hydrogenophilus]NDY74247.1 hypothetical protein [Desulfobacter hydrogenophilus]QBH14577.1 hypothetical protein EYB58_17580 [Desulfobacter hydrogenophilus]RAM00171.1 hypothetical protein DO021_20465 [Desulfobacter hydrogenophilus]
MGTIKIFDLRRLVSWFKEICCWLWEARLGFTCFGVLIIFFTVSFCVCTESSIRLSGLALQIMGMCLAIRGLLKVRTYFQHPSIRNLFQGWFNQFPKWRNNRRIHLKGAITGVSDINANVSIWTNDNPGDLIERRIEAILQNVERLKDFQKKVVMNSVY